MSTIRHELDQKTIQELHALLAQKKLNLSPGFQRESVWTERDRAKLIDSIIRNYPLPNIFLYRREVDGKIIYDVIDGKQRLESVFMFMGAIRGKRFWAKVQLPGEDEKLWVNWKALCRRKKQPLIEGYKLPTVEVNGDLADVIDLFVRINSTGKALTGAEKRHAKYYRSELLKVAGKLANRYEAYFRKCRILSAGQITRMRHVELMCELMVSIFQGDVINKKAALDGVMEAGTLTSLQTQRVATKAAKAINRVRSMFPKLQQTRFHQVSDYYSLVLLIAKFEDEKMILTDRHRNRLAWDILTAFSTGVDQVRDQLKKGRGAKPNQELYREYMLTVLQGTDEVSQRRKREHILRQILQSLFERKDPQRTFSSEQRRILWNSTSVRKCTSCGKQLTWDDFTIDHIDPFSKGGRTRLSNAALMCGKCNSSKGNRRVAA
jgi:hypothetical protein